MSQATASFDALTAPVDKRAARAFWKNVRPTGSTATRIIGGVFVVLFAVVFLGVGTQVIAGFFSAGVHIGGGMGVLFLLVPLVFLAAIVAGLVAVLRSVFGAGSAVRAYRLDQFARANGMTYDVGVKDPQLPGMVFQQGHSRHSSNLVRGRQPRFVEFGNYTYKTGSDKSEATHRWGYVAIKLDVPLPNIVLDATSNNGLFGSNLPERFARAQRLPLEGDFDRHFSLFCPAGYEQDALYLFTPDIMARFIDHAAALDVEIVDDWLFLYAQRDLSTLDPATWRWLFATVGAILDKLAQWARWRDDRLTTDASAAASARVVATAATAVSAGPAHPFAPPAGLLTPPPPTGVAPEGRRLRRSTSVAAIIGVVLFGIAWIVLSTWIRL